MLEFFLFEKNTKFIILLTLIYYTSVASGKVNNLRIARTDMHSRLRKIFAHNKEDAKKKQKSEMFSKKMQKNEKNTSSLGAYRNSLRIQLEIVVFRHDLV